MDHVSHLGGQNLTWCCVAVTVFKERSQVSMRGDGSFQGSASGLHRGLLPWTMRVSVRLLRRGKAAHVHQGGKTPAGPGRWARVTFGEEGLRAGQTLPRKVKATTLRTAAADDETESGNWLFFSLQFRRASPPALVSEGDASQAFPLGYPVFSGNLLFP